MRNSKGCLDLYCIVTLICYDFLYCSVHCQ